MNINTGCLFTYEAKRFQAHAYPSVVHIRMPNVTTEEEDSYRAFAVKMPEAEAEDSEHSHPLFVGM